MKLPISFRGLKPSTRYSPLWPNYLRLRPSDLSLRISPEWLWNAVRRTICWKLLFWKSNPGDLHIFETVYEVFSEGDEITTDRKLNWFVNQFFLHFFDEVKDSILLPLACDESWLTHGFEPSQPRGVHKTWQRFLSLLYHENLDSCFNKHRVWSLGLMQKAPDSTYIIMYTYIIVYIYNIL